MRLALPATVTLLLVAAMALPAHATPVTFNFQPAPGATSVSVAGSFNEWNTGLHPLADENGDGTWSGTLDLPPGEHQYKFVVNGDQWIADESAPKMVDDGFGGKNSVVVVGDTAITLGAAAGGAAATEPAADPAAEDSRVVTFSYQPPDGTSSVTVAGEFNGWNTGATPLTDVDGDGLWTATLTLAPGKYPYKFVINDTDWVTDESAAEFVDDGFGGQNAVVIVDAQSPPASSVGAVAGAAMAASAGAVIATDGAAADGATRFSCRAPSGAATVTVAGTFNDWNVSTHPMVDADQDGVWEADIPLEAGRYEYMFVVDGETWLVDDAATEFAPDGFGGKYSVLHVRPGGSGTGGGAAAVAVPVTAAALAPSGSATTPVTFRYQPVIGGVESVALAGSMNDWNPAATPLTDADEDGVWETTLDLPPAPYEYKFVINGDQWFADDHAIESKDDGFGGTNSVVTVGSVALITGPGGNLGSIETVAASAALREVLFRYRPGSAPTELSLAGSFNDWTVGKTPMTDEDGDGEYRAILLLEDGEYPYKFVVDGNWVTDREHADSFIDDGFGGENSVVRVDDRFAAITVALGDGRIAEGGIEHVQTGRAINNRGDGTVELSFVAHRNDIEGITLVTRSGGAEESVAAVPAGEDGAFSYWSATVAVTAGSGFSYVPVYRDAGTSAYLTRTGFSGDRPAEDTWYTFTEDRFPPFTTPEWVRDAVIYQIFPDRFRNGDPGNDPTFDAWYYEGRNRLPDSGRTNGEYYHFVSDWSDVAGLVRSPYRTDGKPDYFSFYGGDIAGVREKLDYLQDLGVTAIYFNPIAEAKSNHRYDCADYLNLDPKLGTNDEFAAFVTDAHSRGIRIILDIVFNHTGNSHWAFKDAVDKGPESATYDWYEFRKWPLPGTFTEGGPKPEDYYACWWGFGDLPDLNFDLSRPAAQENGIRDIAKADPNTELLVHLKEVVDRWIGELDCDGVRLDVANEVPFWFWREFNTWVKTIKPDAYIVGEIWGNASDWVGPHGFDATMNYAFFREPVLKFIGQGNGSAREFDRSLAAGRNAYPSQAVATMMNLLGSHDTVRYRQQVGGDLNRVLLAMLFGMTYVGAPHIYYGDEIGMMGGKDPDCRRTFPWDYTEEPERVAVHDYVRTLARARADHEALRRGRFTTVGADGQVYAYLRESGEDRILVALNAGTSSGAVVLDETLLGNFTEGVDLVNGETVSLRGLTLPPVSGRALVLR